MAIWLENKTTLVRQTEVTDLQSMRELCQQVYPTSPAWEVKQLESHLKIFPEGQLVAIRKADNELVGMASSLIVNWDDYDVNDPWRYFTDSGYFTNHDPKTGRTLYGAEVMVDPSTRKQGIGRLLYQGRSEITKQLGLLRIRAGARMRGYAAHAHALSPVDYLWNVANFKIFDPTLSFQLKLGFRALAVVPDYLRHDPESMGYAATIEWLNPALTTEAILQKQSAVIKATFGDRVESPTP